MEVEKGIEVRERTRARRRGRWVEAAQKVWGRKLLGRKLLGGCEWGRG